MNNLGVYIITSNGDVLGKPDYSEYNKLNWLKKLICKFSNKYKSKFVKTKPFKIDNEYKKLIETYQTNRDEFIKRLNHENL